MNLESHHETERALLQTIKKTDSFRSQRQLKSCPAYFKTLQIRQMQTAMSKNQLDNNKKADYLNVFVKIIRFITVITKSVFPQEFKYIDANMFRIIGDKAADFNYYVKKDFFKYIKAAPESKFQHLMQVTFFRKWTIQLLLEHLSDGKFLFKPEQSIILIWNMYLLVITNFNFLYCTIKFAFDFEIHKPANYKESEIFLLILPFISYLLDIFVKLNSCYYEAGYLVMDRQKIVKNFYKSTEILYDFFLIVFTLAYFFSSTDSLLSLFMVIKILDMPKRMGLILDKMELTTNYWAVYDLVRLLYLIVIEAHIFSCVLYCVGKANIEISWIVKEGLENEDWLTRYVMLCIFQLTAFYWSIITMTTIGYGDFTPQNLGERTCIIFVAIVSCCTFGYFVSSIGQIFDSIQKKNQQIRLDLNDLKRYLRVRGYNAELQIKIRRYFEYLWSTCLGQEQLDMTKLQQQLPSNLYNEMIIDLNMKSISKIPFFSSNFSEDFLQALAGDFIEEKLTPWQSIFKKNEQSEYLYILCEGEVEYFVQVPEGSARIISIQKMDGQDEIFGQQDFLLDQNHSINCRTTKPSRILKISREKFVSIAKKYGYEKFCQLKDLVKFSGRFDQFHIQCCGCSKTTHLLYNCPMLTGFPSRTKTLLKYKKKYCQERQRIGRSNLERRISTLSLEGKIADSVLYYLLRDPIMSEQLSNQINRNAVQTKEKSAKIVSMPKRGVPIFLTIKHFVHGDTAEEKLNFTNETFQHLRRITVDDQEIQPDESSKISISIKKQLPVKGAHSINGSASASIHMLPPPKQIIEEPDLEGGTNQEILLPSILKLDNLQMSTNFQSMGKFKDIFEQFEHQCDFEYYMPHMNLTKIQEGFQKSKDIDSFHNFIDANIVRRKWKKSQIVVILES